MHKSVTVEGIGTEQVAFRPWGFWSTIGLSLAVGMLAVVSQVVFSIGWVVMIYLRERSIDAHQMAGNGNFLMGCTLFSYPFVLGFMALFIKIRKGNTLADYLQLRKSGLKPMAVWAVLTIAALVLMEGIGVLFHQMQPPEIMVVLVSTTHAGLLFFTMVVGAPLIEELFFRGFMFKGIAASRIGPMGAVIVTTFFWVAIHGFQYGWFPLLYLSMFGIMLGVARAKTGSTLIPIMLHVANNAFSVTAIKILNERGLL